jgi:arylsulfatase A-like enzyme
MTSTSCRFVCSLVALLFLATGEVLAAGRAGYPQRPASPRRPNVVLIVADDLGYADVSSYGATRVRTPNIDRIGREGVLFTNGYVTAPVCGPSRAALMTGRYQQRFGFEFNAEPAAREFELGLGLPLGESTLSDALKAAGYATALVGKWHLGSRPEFHPMKRGFGRFFGILGGGTIYIDPMMPGVENGGHLAQPSPAARNPRNVVVRGEDSATVDNFREYLTDALTHEAARVLRELAIPERPFFLYVSYTAPHAPLQVTRPYYDRVSGVDERNRRIYAAMITALDDGVGTILGELDRVGAAQDTLVVFLSDNGCATYPDYESVCACEPLRGGKQLHYEGGIRVPFALRWPARLPKRTVYDAPVSSLDIFPTIAAAAGAAPRAGVTLDGVDLLPWLARARPGVPHDALYWRSGDFLAVRKGNWKLWISKEGRFRFLFDLGSDTNEARNLYEAQPNRVKELERLLEEWERGLRRPLWPSRESFPLKICGETFQISV